MLVLYVLYLNNCAGCIYDFVGEKSGGSECILVILCSAALFEDAVADTCVGVWWTR